MSSSKGPRCPIMVQICSAAHVQVCILRWRFNQLCDGPKYGCKALFYSGLDYKNNICMEL